MVRVREFGASGGNRAVLLMRHEGTWSRLSRSKCTRADSLIMQAGTRRSLVLLEGRTSIFQDCGNSVSERYPSLSRETGLQ